VTVTLRLFAAAREAAGRGRDEYDLVTAPTVGALLDAAVAAYGAHFGAVLAQSRVWLNGDEPPDGSATPLADDDEVAVLPPVSGGIA
jgi:molybdopterin converting factor small subunit